jgi:O-antigen/teichoic acid export membrane protein
MEGNRHMAKLRRVIGNTFISLLGQAITWSSTLLLISAYGRFLGDAKFGELYFATTFVLLIGFPVESGFNQQLTRDIAQEPEKALQYLSNTLLIKAVLWSVLYLAILLLCRCLGYTVEVQTLVAICGITLLSTSIANTFGSLHNAFERVVYPVVGTILEKGLSAIIGMVLLRLGFGVQIMAFVLLVGSAANTTWQAFWFFRLVGTRISIDWEQIRSLLKTSIPFLIYGILGVIYYRLDTVMLSLMANTTVVGWYGAGYRIFDTLVFLPSLIISAIAYPIFSKLSLSHEEQLKLAIEKSLNFLLLCSLPIATMLIVAAPNIIGFLYHRSEFTPSFPVLQALAPGLVFLYANSVFASIIMSTRHEKRIIIMAAIALIFNLGLNWFLIPRYLHVGAAIVTSLTELLLLGSSVLFTPKNLLPVKSLWVGAKILPACVAMAATIWYLRNLDILLILPLATTVYLISILLLRAIPREDIQAVFQAIRHKGESTADMSISDSIPEIPMESITLFCVAQTEIPVKLSTGEVPTVKIPRITPSRRQVPSAKIPRITPSTGEDLTEKIPRITLPRRQVPSAKIPRVTPSTGEDPTEKIPRITPSRGEVSIAKLPNLKKEQYDSEVTL